MAQSPEPGSPLWWLLRLEKRRQANVTRFDKLHNYSIGDHPLPEGDDRAREVFKAFQKKARTNYCGIVASSVSERLQVDGFRSGSDGTAQTDAFAWQIWQANNLDADSELVHQSSVTFSETYVLIGSDGANPVISIEDPRCVAVELDPLNRRKTIAGIKTWTDDVADENRAVLYLPGSIHYFAARKPGYKGQTPEWRETSSSFTGDAMPEGNPLGELPLVRFVNRPQLDGGGLGEFEDAIDIQDRINNCTLDRLVIAKTQAYRQRWIKGIPSEDEDGNPLDLPFVPGVDMLWNVDADPSEVEFGEFAQVDLRPLLEAARDDVTAFVTLTGLPPHYVAGDLVNASADALAAAEARLVAKVRARQRIFGEAWEHVIKLAARWMNVELPADTEIIWADPERKTDAQLADAAVKKQAAGVPWHQRMEDLHYSPPQIQRMETDRAADALLAFSSAPISPQAPPDAATQ